MRSTIHSSFAAIFQNEVLLNSKRVAPYAMAILFGSNALLWWGWGPAAGRGWATNSDGFISGVLPVYSFFTLPLFTALIMADPVIRDFRIGVAPLIFSKPVSRAEYLLGKFFGNFFVLVCCQSVFVLTLFVLQAFRRPGMIVQEARALPYLKHFLVFVVISHLVLAAVYFTVGTLTRNAKIVYGLGVAFYPLYITYQTVFLKSLSSRWRSVLDPLLMNWGDKTSKGHSAEWINQVVVVYDSDLIANRGLMILIAAICLTILYARFVITEKPGNLEKISTLSLSTASEGAYPESRQLTKSSGVFSPLGTTESAESLKTNAVTSIPLPIVNREDAGIRAHLKKLAAALSIEFRLLRTERSLVVILPLAVLVSFFSLPFQAALSGETYSASFASSSASGLVVFLLGVIVFYTGEAIHRDREVRIEPVLWSTPVPNNVLLFSKFLTTFSLSMVLIVLAGLTAIATQLLRGQTPVEIFPYMVTYSVVLFPTITFMTAASIALNILLRDKYLAYAVSIATGAGLFYLYGLGHNDWLYNPALYQLWTYADLTGAGSNQGSILIQRVYFLAIASACLSLAHLFFPRNSTKGLLVDGHLTSAGWSILIAAGSIVTTVIAGLIIVGKWRS